MSCCDYSHFAAGKVEAEMKLVKSLSKEFFFSFFFFFPLYLLTCFKGRFWQDFSPFMDEVVRTIIKLFLYSLL